MKNQIDQTYSWRSFGDGFGRWESRCRLRIFPVSPELTVVIATDLGKDTGTSITNCAAQLATNVVKDFELDPRSLTWIEHLPDSEAEYSQIEFDWQGRRAIAPRWQFLYVEQVEAFIGESLQPK